MIATDHLECIAEIAVLEEKLKIAEAEVRILIRQKEEIGFRLIDLSQRQLNVIGILDDYHSRAFEWLPLAKLLIRIQVALKMGDD